MRSSKATSPRRRCRQDEFEDTAQNQEEDVVSVPLEEWRMPRTAGQVNVHRWAVLVSQVWPASRFRCVPRTRCGGHQRSACNAGLPQSLGGCARLLWRYAKDGASASAVPGLWPRREPSQWARDGLRHLRCTVPFGPT